MSKFMDDLKKALEGIPDEEVKSIDDKLKRGEKVLGVIEDPYTRKLVFLRNRLIDDRDAIKKARNDAALEHMKKRMHTVIDNLGVKASPDQTKPEDPTPCECAACTSTAALEKVGLMLDAVDSLAATCVHFELSDEARSKIDEESGRLGIRENWQIVLERERPMFPTLEDIFGAFSGHRR